MKLKTIKIVLSGNNFDLDRPGGRSLRIMIILLSQLPLVKVDNRKNCGYNNCNYDQTKKEGHTMESGSSGNIPGRSSNLTTSVVCR